MSGLLGAVLGEGGAALGEAAAGEAGSAIGRATGQSVARAIQERRRKKQACNDSDQAFPVNRQAFCDDDDNGGKAFR